MFQPPLRAIGLLLIASCALAGQQLCIMIKVGQGSRRDLQTTRLPIYNELASLFGRLDNPIYPSLIMTLNLLMAWRMPQELACLIQIDIPITAAFLHAHVRMGSTRCLHTP